MKMLLVGVVIGFTIAVLGITVPIVLAQAPGQLPPLQELIPLPGQRPDDQAGQGQDQNQQDCQTILFYHNGQLYRLRPDGQGPDQQGGRPGSPPEFFHLDPYQGPAIPGLPVPQPGPNFRPVQPRS